VLDDRAGVEYLRAGLKFDGGICVDRYGESPAVA
jgi:hypothetical protein